MNYAKQSLERNGPKFPFSFFSSLTDTDFAHLYLFVTNILLILHFEKQGIQLYYKVL